VINREPRSKRTTSPVSASPVGTSKSICRLSAREPQRPRESLETGIGNPDGVQSRHRPLTAQFHDLELAHDGIALHILIEPEKTVSDGKDGIIARLGFDILPDQKSSGLPTGQEQTQLLHEPFYLDFVFKDFAHHRAEGIDYHDARAAVFDLFGDFC
jgi:hypothetical protein